jgi:hypothetical protein
MGPAGAPDQGFCVGIACSDSSPTVGILISILESSMDGNYPVDRCCGLKLESGAHKTGLHPGAAYNNRRRESASLPVSLRPSPFCPCPAQPSVSVSFCSIVSPAPSSYKIAHMQPSQAAGPSRKAPTKHPFLGVS